MDLPPDGRSSPRIGVFGGTFDPPHVGHVSIATEVADRLGLDRVLWVPAGVPPHKPADVVTPAPLRAEMVGEAVRADPRFELCTVELERAGPSYTVDTLRRLREDHPGAELYLLLGADQVAGLAAWREPASVLRLALPVILDREGERAPDVAPALPGLERALHVPIRRVDVSSTAVRDAVRAGAAWATRVPAGVAAVIRRAGLYRAT